MHCVGNPRLPGRTNDVKPALERLRVVDSWLPLKAGTLAFCVCWLWNLVYFNRAKVLPFFFCCDSCTSKPLEGIRLSGIIGNHIPKLEYDMTELYIVNVEHIKNFRVLVLVMPTPCQEEAYGNWTSLRQYYCLLHPPGKTTYATHRRAASKIHICWL